jgi:hypothetical protein
MDRSIHVGAEWTVDIQTPIIIIIIIIIHLKDPGVDGRIILKWISRGWMGAWTGSIWPRIGTGGGLL